MSDWLWKSGRDTLELFVTFSTTLPGSDPGGGGGGGGGGAKGAEAPPPPSKLMRCETYILVKILTHLSETSEKDTTA